MHGLCGKNGITVIKQLLAAVFDHLLELRAIVCFGGECTINVVFDDRDTVLIAQITR